MHISKTAVLALVANIARAQRPDDTSICNYYTTALLEDNTAENQATLLTLVVNTVVIGNYTEPNVGVKVPGILAPGQYDGTDVNLLPYFTGEFASSNRGGDQGVSVNFLDDGGAEPLKNNKPSNTQNSSQYLEASSLPIYISSLGLCWVVPNKFMALDPNEVGYFITQVGLAASSFGVVDSDVQAVGMALNSLFGYRCALPTTVIASQGPQLQAICIDDTCPLAEEATCGSYDPVVEPSSLYSSESTSATPAASYSSGSPWTTLAPIGTGCATSTGSLETGSGTLPSPTAIPIAGASTSGLDLVAVAGGMAALLLW
ncbi:hypothetical protein GQX73_g2816 [Xylaria multiplex]|uniref:Uncharacterized protein n=1 Tax=Xylaria multiplex TaxID=323545 RepID=A0A7C8MW02_9PEZI|nr:hypothetical protein GQX73_g2816 [Xylaria multiplex]